MAEPAVTSDEPGPGSSGAPASAGGGPLGRAYRHFFRDPWLAILREGEAERAALGGRLDLRAVWILVVCALVMVFEEYYGDRPFFSATFPELSRTYYGPLYEFAWWAGAKVVGYFLVPALLLSLAGIPLAECGLRLRGTSLRVYLWLFLAVLPVVVVASYTAPFQHTYPFYKAAPRSWTDLLAWEAMYGATFFALEFFFRGFLLFPLRRSLGPYAILVMDVPYCMIHFHKPVAEVTGAIFAGLILGTLALRTRSVLGGVLLHVAVAWTMDLLSLLHQGAFPLGRWVG